MKTVGKIDLNERYTLKEVETYKLVHHPYYQGKFLTRQLLKRMIENKVITPAKTVINKKDGDVKMKVAGSDLQELDKLCLEALKLNKKIFPWI